MNAGRAKEKELSMRTSMKKQVAQEERRVLEKKRSAEGRARKEKRKEKGRAEEIAKAIQRSPAGRKAAETLKAKRGLAQKAEQANYQKTKARSATRMGGRRKQIQAEWHGAQEA
jgi:hypothetical protein